MRLCLSVYMQTLKAFKKSSTTQKKLGNKLLKAVNPDNYIEYDDSQISDLFHGKKNAGPYEIAAAKNLDKESYLSCFFDKVMPLLSVGFQPHAIAAFKIIIASDSTISDSAELDFTSGLTKREVLLSDSFCPHTLLAGLLLYALCETQNRGTQKFAAEINASFIERATKEAACITLLKSPGKQSHPFIELWRNGSGSISVKSGDIFSWASTSGNKRKCLLAIPVDTSFSTDLAVSIENSNPFLISENTLHGIFLKRHLYEEAGLIDLKARIKTELNNSRIKKRRGRTLSNRLYCGNRERRYHILPFGNLGARREWQRPKLQRGYPASLRCSSCFLRQKRPWVSVTNPAYGNRIIKSQLKSSRFT